MGILVIEYTWDPPTLHDPSGMINLQFTSNTIREAAYYPSKTFPVVEGRTNDDFLAVGVEKVYLPSCHSKALQRKYDIAPVNAPKVIDVEESNTIIIFRGVKPQHEVLLYKAFQKYETEQPALFIFVPSHDTFDYTIPFASQILPQDKTIILHHSPPLSFPIRIAYKSKTIMIVPGGVGKKLRRCIFTSDMRNTTIPKGKDQANVTDDLQLAKTIVAQGSCRPWRWRNEVDYTFRLFPRVDMSVLGEKFGGCELDGTSLVGVPLFPNGWLELDPGELSSVVKTF